MILQFADMNVNIKNQCSYPIRPPLLVNCQIYSHVLSNYISMMVANIQECIEILLTLKDPHI